MQSKTFPGPYALAASMLILAACSDGTKKIGADWGCGELAGVEQISVASKPAYVLVGEFTETREAPEAFAELACSLARSGRPLFVGYVEHLGGPTDAETRMRARLDELIGMGAPITAASVGGEREWSARDRSAAEKRWAETISAQVEQAGAARALILLPRVDAALKRVSAQGERFAGYDPMPLHLAEDEVLSLEIASHVSDAGRIEMKIYPAIRDGFHGELVLASLTRPAFAPAPLATETPLRAGSNMALAVDNSASIHANLESLRQLRAEFLAAASGSEPRDDRIAEVLASLDEEIRRLEGLLQEMDAEAASSPDLSR